MTTKHITYRSPKLLDLDQLLNYINTLSKEETYIRFQGVQLTKEDEESYLKKIIKDVDDKKTVKILAFAGDILVGVGDIKMDFGALAHVGAFGLTVHKEYRNQGIGTQLLSKTIDEAKKNIKELEIITLGVFSDNQRALHLYKKFGFKEYGVLPNGVIRKGQYADHIYMYLDVR